MRLVMIAVVAMALSTSGLAAIFVHALHVPTKPQLFLSDFRPSVWKTTIRKTEASNEKWGSEQVAILDVQVLNAAHAP
jgi:hypothetical protein